MRSIQTALVVFAVVAAASAQTTVDFTTDDFGTPLVNGQDISTPPEFGNFIEISSAGSPNLGATIFDSDPNGPNSGGADPDLLVDLGNILILQNNAYPTQTVPGIFDTPNDEEDGGTLIFDFTSPLEPLEVTLVDINGSNQNVLVTLLDTNSFTRTYDVPSMWTKDVTSGPLGYDMLDLTTLAPQLGEGGATATATEDVGFDGTSVVNITFEFDGSAGLDNFKFIPEPTSLLLLAVGAGLIARRR